MTHFRPVLFSLPLTLTFPRSGVLDPDVVVGVGPLDAGQEGVLVPGAPFVPGGGGGYLPLLLARADNFRLDKLEQAAAQVVQHLKYLQTLRIIMLVHIHHCCLYYTVTMLNPMQSPRIPPELATNQMTGIF